jgi:hypothetical protein
MDQIAMEPYLINEYESKENPLPTKIHILSKKRYSDSAEKYFDWASKTNRKFINKKEKFIFYFFPLGPMEYFRGKRSLRFTKKDEYVNNHKKILRAGLPSGLLRQGVWRSGIVGRRRR